MLKLRTNHKLRPLFQGVLTYLRAQQGHNLTGDSPQPGLVVEANTKGGHREVESEGPIRNPTYQGVAGWLGN